MLHNIVYIGHLAQGKSASCLHKGIPFHWTDPSEWDIAENTHEPIIPMALWERVQRVNQSLSSAAKSSHGKYANLPKRENPYGSLLRCADCGRVIKQVRSYNTSKRVEPKAITHTNAPGILSLEHRVVCKEVSAPPIWI